MVMACCMDLDRWIFDDEGALDSETGLLRFAASEAANAEVCAARAFEAEQMNASLKVQLNGALSQISKLQLAIESACACPVCRQPMYRPWTLTECGCTVCQMCLKQQLRLQLNCPDCSTGVIEQPVPSKNLRKLLVDCVIATGGTVPWEAVDFMNPAQWNEALAHVSQELSAGAEPARSSPHRATKVNSDHMPTAPANHED
ncbi:hypothetical protein BKA62DRAFT_667327 [Auriculariales sp. MPI-PUGE-AT-0066]|nr:hypothetical protein BKA62DRAFT_667327 [Auriculariales sp. MPI-PUGE-AT-0066]